MPWQETTVMSERQEFVAFAGVEGANAAALCRRYGISRKTGYKWLGRAAVGEGGADRSRRPHASPRQTAPAVEAAVLATREAHPAWGGRKRRHAPARRGVAPPPAASTITAILRRHGRPGPPDGPPHADQRFEHPAPNDLWRIDFMGQPDLPTGKVHPLTVLDDHSRFALLVAACPHEQAALVQEHLTALFRRYGLPRRILTGNGPPWGTAGSPGLSALEAWWLRLGVAVTHGRPHHPQTQGKLERLHRTIWAETRGIRDLPDLATAQRRFDAWRAAYNHERPHAALGDAVPASRYQPSPRPFPETLPEIVYGPDDLVRHVFHPGRIPVHGRAYFVGHGLIGQPVALRPTGEALRLTVWSCQHQVAIVDLTERP